MFLAAMSSSRSEDVTKFVCPSVRSHFFSFIVLGVLSSPKGFEWCFKKVLRMIEASSKFQGCFKQVLRVFTKSLKEV